MNALKRWILWEYPRASWQYDVIVGAILVFIFVTPNYISFGDRPKPASIAIVRGGYWIEPQQLAGVPDNLLAARAAIKPAQDFLRTLQYGEGAHEYEGMKDTATVVSKDHAYYGGFGYGGAYYGGYYDPWYGGYASYPQSSSSYSDEGALRLKIKPREAAVYVDGYYVGIVDNFDGIFQKLHIESGAHRIEVRAAGFETLTFDVRITPDHSTTYQGEMKKIQ
jgi:hypothetical protein